LKVKYGRKEEEHWIIQLLIKGLVGTWPGTLMAGALETATPREESTKLCGLS
jgi:hypothetical protein